MLLPRAILVVLLAAPAAVPALSRAVDERVAAAPKVVSYATE